MNGLFRAKLKLDLSSIDVFIDFSLIDIALCSETHDCHFVANSLRASNFSYHYYFWFSDYRYAKGRSTMYIM